MEDSELNGVVDRLVSDLKATFGYCGVASSDNSVYINSTAKGNNDFTIIIKVEG